MKTENLARWSMAVWLLLAGACGEGEIGDGEVTDVESALASTITIKGRLVIPDDYDCTGGTTSLAMSWTACHAFKKHFDPATGAAITSNAYVPGARRPLSGRVTVVYQAVGNPNVCDVQMAQTDDNGNFSAKVRNCSPNLDGVASFTVSLEAPMKNPSKSAETLGTVRALWDKKKIPQPYLSLPENIVYSAYGEDFIVPAFGVAGFYFTLAPHSSTENVGMVVVSGNDFPAPYQAFARGALAAWQNTIAIHQRARSLLKESGVAAPYAAYAALFEVAEWSKCDHCYTALFDLAGQFGGGVGGAAEFVTAAPAADITEAQVMALSSAGLIAHEFGHGLTGSLAPGTMMIDSTLSNAATNADGSNDFIVHSPLNKFAGGVFQVQDQPEAMTEGFGAAMARFLLLDGCDGDLPLFSPVGDPDMLHSMWNTPFYDGCDAQANSGCPTHNFRWQMHARGVAEGSAEWNRRRAALNALATTAANGGMKYVLSNNESKAQRFYCKLLASKPDYATMSGKVKGQAYVDDYPFLVSEILDGRSPATKWRSYASDVGTSKPHLSLLKLLRALNAECPTCGMTPSPIPTPMWQLPTLVDGGNGAYDREWISTSSRFSPQSLASIIVANGWATKSQMNTALRASYMEELP